MSNYPQGSTAQGDERISRRTFLKGALLGAAGLGFGGGAVGLHSVAVAPYAPTVDRVEVALPGFPAGATPVSIVQISDIHVRGRFTIDDVRRAVEIANSLEPDVVALTGDFVYHDAGLLDDGAVELGRLRARFGRFAVLGNHDYWTDVKVVSEALRRNGIDLLTNAATRIGEDTALWLAGVDDVWSGNTDLGRALKPVPEKAPIVLLCHEPDFADQVPARVGLQLSGHTHGGQVRLPGIGAPIRPRYGVKYQIGLNQAKETLVYVNRGLGVIDPPIRISCPPEITHLILRSA